MRLNPVLAAAFRFSAETGSSHVGAEHLLVAVLDDESTVASRVLRELGVSRAKVSHLYRLDSKPEAERTGGAVTTPAVHGVMGMARGLALAHGASDADSSHVLLALIYGDSSLMTSGWETLGVRPAEVVARLSDAGVAVPPQPPPEREIPRITNGVVFPEEDLQLVLKAMVKRYPPGSDVHWGWNKLDADRCVIYTAEVPSVLSVVEAAVADADAATVSLVYPADARP
jgi:hypothetical protein